MTAKAQDISSKNTKAEILKAYNDAMNQLEKTQSVSLEDKKTQNDNKAIVSQAIQTSSETLTDQVTQIRATFVKELDQLKDALLDKNVKVHDLDKAIKLQEEYLKDLYEIKVNAQTLSGLLLACQKERQAFGLEMAEKREAWKADQQALEKQRQEDEAERLKARKRGEEEYAYMLSVKRRQEQEVFEEQKKQDLEEIKSQKQLLDERDQALKEKEQDFNALQKRVEGVPQEFEELSSQVEQKVRKELESQHKATIDLREKEIQGQTALMEHKIQTLEAKIAEQDALIKYLNKKTDDAASQVQSIACRALDASSERFHSGNFADKNRPEKTAA